MEKFRSEISKIDFASVSNSMDNFQTLIETVLKRITDQNTNDTLEQINSLQAFWSSQKKSLLQEEIFKLDLENFQKFTQIFKDQNIQQDFGQLIELVKKVRLDLKDEGTLEKFRNSLENILSSFTLTEVEQLKNTKIEELIDALPSCRILSDLYQSLTLSVCYEFIDNFNTFWSTLFILTILFFTICCFAFVQADLLRKYYRYDELLDEDVGEEKSSAQFDMNRQRSGRTSSGAIDAYEMKGYNNSGMKYPSNRSSPSTRNTRA